MEYIRRKDVLEAFEPLRPWGWDLQELRERIERLPTFGSADGLGPVKCPICREPLYTVVNYCPFCGERLRLDIGAFL